MKEKSEQRKNNLLEELSKLIECGVFITKCTQDFFAHREDQDRVDNMLETHKDYQNWKMDTRDFFLCYGFDDEANLFDEGTSVPLLTSGIGYSHIETPESKELLKNIREETKEKLKILRDFKKEVSKEMQGRELPQDEDQERLKSIYLVVTQLAPKNAIFLVFDGWYNLPIRFWAKNRDGKETAIKKLYDIAYFVDAPESSVPYEKRLADNINNGLFKKKRVSNFMKTNKIKKKPTLVIKSGDFFALKNEIPVKVGIVKYVVPAQHQSLYRDKT